MAFMPSTLRTSGSVNSTPGRMVSQVPATSSQLLEGISVSICDGLLYGLLQWYDNRYDMVDFDLTTTLYRQQGKQQSIYLQMSQSSMVLPIAHLHSLDCVGMLALHRRLMYYLQHLHLPTRLFSS